MASESVFISANTIMLLFLYPAILAAMLRLALQQDGFSTSIRSLNDGRSWIFPVRLTMTSEALYDNAFIFIHDFHLLFLSMLE